MVSENWTRENIAWAAGLFEGEGSISIKPQTAQLHLAMTDEDVVRKFHAIVGMGNVYGPGIDKRKPHYKPSWRWAVGGSKKSQALLAAFWPFLGARRQAKARDAISSCARRTPYGESKVRCANGHEFTQENTYRSSQGKRACVTCRALASSLGKIRKKVRTGHVDYQL